MKIMGISGLPGSGKGLVSEIAVQNGAIVISMGDIIRKEHGQYIVAELTIKEIKEILEEGFDKSIIVEGIRSPFEVNLFKENFDNFMILSVFANRKLRFERIKSRQREDDTTDYEIFVQRDQRELDFGIGVVISLSDKIIINESDMESYEKEIREFFEEYDI